MIGVIFQYATEVVEVRVQGESVFFRTSQSQQFAQIDGIKLDYHGVCREFPDLEIREDWKQEAAKRFKDKIKSFPTEEERVKYIIEDLSKFGYKPLYMQKQGFRPVKIK